MDNIRSAFKSVLSNKVRSLLTVLGVIIGVSSVTALVSLGQGLKDDVSSLIRGFGTNVIVVISGQVDGGFNMSSSNPANLISGDILTIEDYLDIAGLESIESSTPLTMVPGSLKYEEETTSPIIFGIYPNIEDAFEVLSLERGRTFKSAEEKGVIILGAEVEKVLFDEQEALGRNIYLNKQEFEVIGVLGRSKSTSIFGSEFDSIAAITFDAATDINNGQEKILRIIAKANNEADIDHVKEEITALILDNHEGEQDFTVLTQDDLLELFNQFLNLSTVLVTAIAAISLVVGGIGIMNIMLVTVTERVKEIGLRKAVGATNRAILFQFLTEAVVISLIGGILGLGISYGVGLIVIYKTDLTPSMTPLIISIALGISVLEGIVFGLWPAYRAAKQDPIQALRNE